MINSLDEFDKNTNLKSIVGNDMARHIHDFTRVIYITRYIPYDECDDESYIKNKNTIKPKPRRY